MIYFIRSQIILKFKIVFKDIEENEVTYHLEMSIIEEDLN